MSHDETPEHRPASSPDRGLIAVVAAGLVLRAAVVIAALRDPAIPRSTDDYVSMAQGWLETGEYARFEWPPVYIYICRVFLALLGPDAVFHALLVMHLAIGAASVYLVYCIARRLGLGGTERVLAAAVTAIEPSIVIHTGLALTETLYVFLLLLGIQLALVARDCASRRQGILWALAAGAVLGLGSLARYVGLPVAAMLVAWLAVASGKAPARPRLARAGAALAVVAAVNLAWMTRNWLDVGHFELNSAGGHNFAVMWVGPARLIYEGYAVDSYNCLYIWEQDAGPGWYADDKFVQARAAGRAAMRWALAHPFPVLLGLVRSGAMLWFGPGRAPFEKIIGIQNLPPWLTGLLYAWHFAFAVLTLAGIAFWWGRRRETRSGLVLVLLLIAAHQLSLGCSGYNRYLVPIVPFAAIVVAVALVDGPRWARAVLAHVQQSGLVGDDSEKPSRRAEKREDAGAPELGDLLNRLQAPRSEQEDEDT